MAKTTPRYALPYPDPEDIPDIAGDIQKLALATEAMVSTGLASGVWGQGSMAGYPADSKLGTPIYLDSLNQLRAKPFATVRHSVDPIASYAANFKADSGGQARYWVQWGPFIGMQIAPTRINSDLVGPANSDIGNASIGTLRSDIPRPNVYHGFVNAWAGPIITFNVSISGVITMAMMASTGRWAVNTCLPQFFFYMSQDVISL